VQQREVPQDVSKSKQKKHIINAKNKRVKIQDKYKAVIEDNSKLESKIKKKSRIDTREQKLLVLLKVAKGISEIIKGPQDNKSRELVSDGPLSSNSYLFFVEEKKEVKLKIACYNINEISRNKLVEAKVYWQSLRVIKRVKKEKSLQEKIKKAVVKHFEKIDDDLSRILASILKKPYNKISIG
ncbi:43674_t:CDS:2, partial [Gigaspora margarita]